MVNDVISRDILRTTMKLIPLQMINHQARCGKMRRQNWPVNG